ncbi:MAG: nicotinate-nucleotide adenylyltransferase [Desulfobacterales bacterium]|nr:nicotinate-nucleotide adenylyltransferase [Desulfobacterales bacterium]
MKRIGLFGGTFNPLHIGHLLAADEVCKKFPLDHIYFIPSATPPHKEPEVLAGADDRLAMIRLAIADYPLFSASDVEVSRPGPSFTIDTVRYYKSNLPEEIDLYLIMGFDAFLELHTWKSYLNLLKLISFIVMSRPCKAFSQSPRGWKILEEYLSRQISDRYRFSPERSCYDHPDNPSLFLMDINLTDISSTRIRRSIKTGLPIDRQVPPVVDTYIKTKGLYV